MENLAAEVLRNAYENFRPETPRDKMLCALVKEQVCFFFRCLSASFPQDKNITDLNARIATLEKELKSKTMALTLLHRVKQTQREHIVLQRDIIQKIEGDTVTSLPSRSATSRSHRNRKREVQYSIPPAVSIPNQSQVLSRRTPFQRRSSLYQSTIIA
jgi:hypothetical protein